MGGSPYSLLWLWESSGPSSTPGSRSGHSPAFPWGPSITGASPVQAGTDVWGAWLLGSGLRQSKGLCPRAPVPRHPHARAQWKPYDQHPLHQVEARSRKTGRRRALETAPGMQFVHSGPYMLRSSCLVSHCFSFFQRAEAGFFANPHPAVLSARGSFPLWHCLHVALSSGHAPGISVSL